jgi:uncharacterized membrane protein
MLILPSDLADKQESIDKPRHSFQLQLRCCLKAILQKTDNADKQEYTGVSRLDCFFFILHYTRAQDPLNQKHRKSKKKRFRYIECAGKCQDWNSASI